MAKPLETTSDTNLCCEEDMEWVNVGGDPESSRNARTTRVKKLVMMRYHKHRRERSSQAVIAADRERTRDENWNLLLDARPKPMIDELFPCSQSRFPKAESEFYLFQFINVVGQAFCFRKDGRNDFLSMYLPMISQDQLTYSAALCTVSSCWSTHAFVENNAKQKHARHATMYNGHAVSLLRERIGDWETVDLDRFVISMCALIMSEMFLGSANCATHLNGLRRVIDLRGGLSRLSPMVRRHAISVSLKIGAMHGIRAVFPPISNRRSYPKLFEWTESGNVEEYSVFATAFSSPLFSDLRLLDIIRRLKDIWIVCALEHEGHHVPSPIFESCEELSLCAEFDLLTYAENAAWADSVSPRLNEVTCVALQMFINTRIWTQTSSAPLMTSLATKLLRVSQQLLASSLALDTGYLCWVYVQGARSSEMRPSFSKLLYDHCVDQKVSDVAQLAQALKPWLFLDGLQRSFLDKLWADAQQEHGVSLTSTA